MQASDALRRIAYLLERDGAETYKVRAFRRAAAAVDRVDEEELGRLASSGGLKRLEGVGDTTARVIAEAVAGKVPSYLEELEASAPAALSPQALAIRTTLKGDCHSHSDWSDGGSPILEMAETAVEIGHEYLALTDHSPRLTVARGLAPNGSETSWGWSRRSTSNWHRSAFSPASRSTSWRTGHLIKTTSSSPSSTSSSPASTPSSRWRRPR